MSNVNTYADYLTWCIDWLMSLLLITYLLIYLLNICIALHYGTWTSSLFIIATPLNCGEMAVLAHALVVMVSP